MKFVINVSYTEIVDRKMSMKTETQYFNEEFNSFDKACAFGLSKAYEYFQGMEDVRFHDWQDNFGIYRWAQLSKKREFTVYGSTISVEINKNKSWYEE